MFINLYTGFISGLILPILIGFLFFQSGCGKGGGNQQAGQDLVRVFVSLPPLGYVAERIGGNSVSVMVLIKPGQSPHNFEITPRQMTALSGAELYFTTNMPFEKKLSHKLEAVQTGPKIVDVSKGVRVMKSPAHNCSGCSSRAHSHAETEAAEPDPHIWMSPRNLGIIAGNVAKSLKEVNPDSAFHYDRRLERLLAEIDSTDKVIRERLKPFRGESFYVFHPAFGYFARAYDLIQVPVEIEGKSPSPKQLNDLIAQARRSGVKVIFVQPQFDRKAAVTVAQAVKGKVVPADPLAKDVLRNFSEIAAKVDSALK